MNDPLGTRPEARTTRQPGGDPVPGQPVGFDPVGEAKALLRATPSGALATIDAGTGAPVASLVSVATDHDGAAIILVSALSAHTANLRAEPRVSLLLGRTGKGDPLAHPRLTLAALAEEDEALRPRLRTRFLARHPKAALYADFGDFAFVRLVPMGGHLNGGFARAARLSAEELTTPLDGAEALLAGEAGAVVHMNQDHADALALYATALLGRRPGRWRLTGLDPEGCDLARGGEAARLPFPSRVATPGELQAMLVRLAGEARSASRSAPGVTSGHPA